MVGSPLDAMLALVEITVAMVLFHRALPSVLQGGRLKAFQIWALAMALGMFGVDRFAAYINGTHTSPLAMLGHCWLAAYGVLRFAHIARRGLTAWGVAR